MNITKDVILDLLPLYEAGEVSADTRALVEEFLAAHPEVARPSQSADAMLKRPVVPGSEHERRAALARTQALMRQRHWFLAGAIAATLTAFSFGFNGRQVIFFMWRDTPLVALGIVFVAVFCWLRYWRASQALKVGGL